MKSKRLYTQEEISKLSLTLAELKDKPKPLTAVSASGAVAQMIREIQDLQSVGYTISEIANILHENDLPISAGTLKSAISRTQTNMQKTPRTKKPQATHKTLPSVALAARENSYSTKAEVEYFPSEDIDDI